MKGENFCEGSEEMKKRDFESRWDCLILTIYEIIGGNKFLFYKQREAEISREGRQIGYKIEKKGKRMEGKTKIILGIALFMGRRRGNREREGWGEWRRIVERQIV